MNSNQLRNYAIRELHFCSCGDEDYALHLLRDILQIFRDRNKEGNSHDEWCTAHDRFYQITEHQGLLHTYLFWLDGLGLIRHAAGTEGPVLDDIEKAWLTEKGEEVLDALDRNDLNTLLGDYADHLDPKIPEAEREV